MLILMVSGNDFISGIAGASAKNSGFRLPVASLPATGSFCKAMAMLTFLLFALMVLPVSAVANQADGVETNTVPGTETKRSETGNSAVWGNNDKVAGFINEVAAKHKFDQNYLQQLFAQVRRKQDIIEAISRPAEKVLAWKEYQNIFLTRERIREGKVFMLEQQKHLDLATEEFGIPRSVIAAIIGVETFYGKYKGKHRVIDALSTLAFAYPPRSKFFRQELEQFLLLSREQGFEPLTLNGSYAGAMGYGQFIPSSYRHYAVDFDGDEVVDLLASKADAIGSVANYLHKHGWSRQSSIVAQARLKGNESTYRIPRGLKLSQTISALKQAGADFKHADADSAKARLLRLKGKQGSEYWVAMNNFYVITRYNRSDLYAMAVYQLSQALEDR